MTTRLERLLRPRSIAIFGGREARRVVEQSLRVGFAGEIWPVHPSHEDVAGRRCFRSVPELPGVPDAAFVGINRHRTVEIVAALARRGAGGAVCYANGYRESDAETGDGAALESRLVAAAGAMPLIGPNCYGLINYLDGALLWPDQHGGTRVERGVALLTQSSNMALNLTMQQRGLPIAYVLTVGNQAQTGMSELASALVDDPRVTAIGLHIEGLDDVAAFEHFARHARSARKPLVALKAGRSEQARAATISHTASISGSDAGSRAFFKRLGVPEVDTIPELLESLKLLHVHGALSGFELASMSCSGGEASLMADAAVGRRVRFRSLEAAEAARVRAAVGERVAVANPLDYQTFIWADEDRSAATFAGMAGLGFDLTMLLLDLPRADRCSTSDWDIAIRALVRGTRETGAKTAVVTTMPENMPEERAAELVAHRVAPLFGIPEAITAAEVAARIGVAWGKPAPEPVLAVSGVDRPGVLLDEAVSKRRLAAFGLAIPERRVAATLEEAVVAAEVLGYPVALKALGLAHKSEVGAVRLGLQDAVAVATAARAMANIGKGFLVEHMISGAVAELLVGVTRDPVYGLMMTVGAGGVLVELLGDAATFLLPTSDEEIRATLLSLRTAPLLTGYRGRPSGDLDAAVAACSAIARFALTHADMLDELEVNPLMVLTSGAVAGDALIRIREG